MVSGLMPASLPQVVYVCLRSCHDTTGTPAWRAAGLRCRVTAVGRYQLVPKYQRQNQTLGWYGTTTAHCENLLRIGPHQLVKAAEMTVSLHYWQPPWIFRRNQAYDFVGIVDPADGRVRRWVHR